MSNQPQASGADLARQALAAYKATSKTTPASKQKKPAKKPVRGPGREPVTLGGALDRVSTEQGWGAALTVGSVLDRWAELCPQYVDRIQPVHYDPERRVLELRPCSPAYAAQLRLLGGQLAKQINDKVGSDVVRAIKPLPIGAVAGPPPHRPEHAETSVAPVAPVKTRDTASPGYHAALAAIRKKQTTTADALVAAAIERQTKTAAREPETVHTDAQAALDALHAGQELARSDEVRQAAIRRKHSGDKAVRTAFDVA